MPIDCLPKQIIYRKLIGGKRLVGRPKLKYKDVIKRDMKDYLANQSYWLFCYRHQSIPDSPGYQAHEASCSQSTTLGVMLAFNRHDAANKSIVLRDRSWPLLQLYNLGNIPARTLSCETEAGHYYSCTILAIFQLEHCLARQKLATTTAVQSWQYSS